jgi:hypothetical protein
MFGAPFPGVNRLTASYVGHGEDTSGSATSTINIAFDPAFSNRWLVIGLGWFGPGGMALTSVTIGGVAATQIVSSGGVFGAGIWAALVPTNGTQTVVTTYTGFVPSRVAVALYSVDGVGAALAASSSSFVVLSGGVESATFSIPAGGFGLGFAMNESPSHPTNTWANFTEDVDFQFSASIWSNTAAHDNFPSGRGSSTVTCTVTGSTPVGIGAFAAFGP